ncbi:MAG: acylphosphatase [Gammaproteobacteria bacterium]|nr:acylphosphatase [Gammaproteobacteria bacterium]
MTEAGGVLHCVHFRIHGQVQGVFYRASAREAAGRLGLTGWVRNCPDGDVELVACGTLAQLEVLEDWLWQGPPAAHVTSVRRREAPLQSFIGFEILR